MHTAEVIAVFVAPAFLSAAGTAAAFKHRLRRAEQELATALAELRWWQRSALNFADRNKTLRQTLNAAKTAHGEHI